MKVLLDEAADSGGPAQISLMRLPRNRVKRRQTCGTFRKVCASPFETSQRFPGFVSFLPDSFFFSSSSSSKKQKYSHQYWPIILFGCGLSLANYAPFPFGKMACVSFNLCKTDPGGRFFLCFFLPVFPHNPACASASIMCRAGFRQSHLRAGNALQHICSKKE